MKTKNQSGPCRARILLLRGARVMPDADLAELYGVPVKRINEQVRRNARRFPADFMFRLGVEEARPLHAQRGGRGAHRKYLPSAFTEQGVAMLSSVLHSERAIQVNIGIMRAFVRMRRAAVDHQQLSRRIDAFESKTDARFQIVFEEMGRLKLYDERRRRRRIGFGPV